MKPILATAALGALMLAAGASAETNVSGARSADLDMPSLAVRERLQAIEQVNVTAEKTAQDELDEQLESILDEVSELEFEALKQDGSEQQ